MSNCVIVGSSNALPSTWGPEFCSAHGLTMRNFAVGGSGYTTPQGFQSQLQNAASDPSFSNDDVALVVLCDASNDIRGNNDTGHVVSVQSAANAAMEYARYTFSQARIVVLPVIWPSTPPAYASQVPGGYQQVWHSALSRIVDELRIVAAWQGAELVEQSWTWLTGRDDLMKPGEVHPNAAGYSEIAQWLGKHMRGEQTRRDTRWCPVPYHGDARKDSNALGLRVRREGWTVHLEGGVIKPSDGGWYTDLAVLPVGFRPYDFAPDVAARFNGSAIARAATVYPGGTLRLWESVPANTLVTINGSYQLG